jgi:hypothetical protein
MKFVSARDPQSLKVQGLGMLLATYESPHFRDTRQVRRIQTPDRSATDDTNSFHK